MFLNCKNWVSNVFRIVEMFIMYGMEIGFVCKVFCKVLGVGVVDGYEDWENFMIFKFKIFFDIFC